MEAPPHGVRHPTTGLLPSALPPVRSRAISMVFGVLLIVLAALSISVLSRTFGSTRALAPDFTLVDQDAQAFTLSTLRGHPVVLFFGYAHCPDVCPTTLARLAKGVHSSGAPGDTQVVFVTVDPERDSPAELKRYVRLFDPAFMGLTGTPTALSPVYAAYHVLRRSVPANHAHTEYSVSHGTTVYYIGRDGAINGLGNWDDATPQIARNVKEYQ